MSDKTIYFDYPTVQQAAANYKARHEGLTTILADLESGLAPMLASWDGTARDMYVQQTASWDAAALDLTNLLQSIITETHSAHDGYATLVENVHNLWS